MPDVLHDPVTVGIGSAVITGGLAWLGQRLVGKAAIQEAVNEGFRDLIGSLRQELRVAYRERDHARSENTELKLKIEELERLVDALELRVAGSVLPR